MNRRLEKSLKADRADIKSMDKKLAAYLAAAAAVGTTLASDADAAIVGNNTVVPFGINDSVAIDWNGDGGPEFEIDHDRLSDMGMETSDPSGIDFLQIDKVDQVELALPGTDFPGGNMSAEYLTDVGDNYPSVLSLGDQIGSASPGVFEFQETKEYCDPACDFTRRSNRLIDEDNGFIDANVGTLVNSHVDTPNWLGLNGDVGYLGLRIQLGGAGESHYGWVGVRVTNEDDATGEVVGFAYNDVPGAPIPAGVVPEPGTMALAALGGITLTGSWVTRKFFRK